MNFTWTNGRSLETVTKGDLTTSYKYNQDNLRTSKTVNGVTTTYIWEDSTLIADETSGIVTWYIYDDNGSVIGFQRQESADSKTFTTYYYEKNLQGDIVAIYGEDGTELAGYTYSAWGEITGITGDENLAKSNPWRYRRYYYDEEIGMYYLQSRYYDAEVGRFLNADDAKTLLLVGCGIKGANLFEYCFNNPINKCDPTGFYTMGLSISYYVISQLSRALAGIMTGINASIASIKAAIVSSWNWIVCAAAAIVAVGALIYTYNRCQAYMANANKTISAVKAKIRSGGSNGKGHTVYVIFEKNTTNVVYVGRTCNYSRRKSQHEKYKFNKNKYTMMPIASNLSYLDSRALEQTIICAYTLIYLKELTPMGNRINSISPAKWKKFKKNFERVKLLIEANFDPE